MKSSLAANAFQSQEQKIKKFGLEAHSSSDDENQINQEGSDENFSEDEDTRKLRKEVVR